MAQPKLKILLLGDDSLPTGTVIDYIQAFFCHAHHDFVLLNPVRVRKFPFALTQFDAVLIHYSVFIISEWHLSSDMAESLRVYQGLKAQIIQDEYRTVDQMAARMAWLGIHLIFTHLPPEEIAKGYPQACLDGVTKYSLPVTGFPPDQLWHYPVAPLRERPLDIVYRGRNLPYHLGSLGQEKAVIAAGVEARAAHYGLKTDIAWEESARIYGDAWLRFIGSARAALGTESGASVWDFTGALEECSKAYLKTNPQASFAEVQAACLRDADGKINYTSVSPRLFEAVCLRTALVLFEGHYGGIFLPGTHYIELKKDFSNFPDVAAQIKDLRHLETLTERALQDIILSGKYSEARFIGLIDQAMTIEYQKRAFSSASVPGDRADAPSWSAWQRISSKGKQYIVYHTRQCWFYAGRALSFTGRVLADRSLDPAQKLRLITSRVISGLRLAKDDFRRTTATMFGLEIRLAWQALTRRWTELFRTGTPTSAAHPAPEPTIRWCLRSRQPRRALCVRCTTKDHCLKSPRADNL
ncbi:MAG: hypothetical protein WBK91_05720 [Alphaproteobacteria bacterium]